MDDVWARGQLALAFESTKQFQEAVEEYTQVLLIEPENEWGLQRRAFLNHYELKNIPLALEDYDQILMLHPSDAKIFLQGGKLNISLRFIRCFVGFKSSNKNQ